MTTTLHPLARLPDEWRAWMTARGHRPYRAGQVFRWLHERGVLDAEAMTDLPKALRAELSTDGLRSPARVERVVRSVDGTRKLLLRLEDGASVEAVLIPMTPAEQARSLADDEDGDPEEDGTPGEGSDADRRTRVTLCLSSQFGCAMGCVFCASGQSGLRRGLTAAEIVAQVHLARGHLDDGEKLQNLVYMGMGEPLHHYDETARSLRLLTSEGGLAMSLRRITVSTVGLLPNLARLGRDFDGKVGLAVSLHAPDDETRSAIVPMNRRYPIAALMAALDAYPLPKRRRITIEYTLIEGVNDGPQDARRLVELLAGRPVKLNLIPMNRIDASELQGPDDERLEAFRAVVERARISCFVRTRRGDDVAAACGQLAFRDSLVPVSGLQRD